MNNSLTINWNHLWALHPIDRGQRIKALQDELNSVKSQLADAYAQALSEAAATASRAEVAAAFGITEQRVGQILGPSQRDGIDTVLLRRGLELLLEHGAPQGAAHTQALQALDALRRRGRKSRTELVGVAKRLEAAARNVGPRMHKDALGDDWDTWNRAVTHAHEIAFVDADGLPHG